MAIRTWTTLDLDPREVHQVGLEELAAIDAERRAIARAAGFGDDVDAYRAALAADPANRPRRRRSSSRARRRTSGGPRRSRRASSGACPVAGCEVRPVEAFMEKDAPFAYYYPPTVDGSRPGIYFVNTYDLPEPARSRSSPRRPTTRRSRATTSRSPWRWSTRACTPSGASGRGWSGGAYVEGWGLYSERLADELGLYRNAGGALRDARRPGLARRRGWSSTPGCTASAGRASSRSTGCCETGLSETDAVIETDRYIAWPGQALTYMIGMREIRRLRRELEARDGDRVRPAGVPRRAARPRLAAARDPGARAAALGGAGPPDRGPGPFATTNGRRIVAVAYRVALEFRSRRAEHRQSRVDGGSTVWHDRPTCCTARNTCPGPCTGLVAGAPQAAPCPG